MMQILFSSSDTAFMDALPEALHNDLQEHGLAQDLQISSLPLPPVEVTKGDPVTLAMVALTAAGAGGALTTMLGKDGFLSALVQVLVTYNENQKVSIVIKEDGREIEVSGPASKIEGILKALIK